MTDLGSLTGDSESYAVALNEAGQIIGYSNEAVVRRAFVWENGVMIDLGSLGDYSIEPVAINEAGEVIGWSNTTGNAYAMRHAFVANAGMPPPTVAINQASGQADPASSSPINFTAVFSETVTGFGDSAADVSLSGTAGSATAVITEIAPNDGTTYNVAVSGMTISGIVIASIPAGAATNATNDGNTPSTSTDNTVTFNTPPSAPTCNGQTATIYVNAQGMIVGGPEAKLYRGNLNGTNGPDVIVGTDKFSDSINGYGGNDIICGGYGNDKISGGAGDDQLFGEAGNDRMNGGSGADNFTGGSGTDTANDYDNRERDTKSSVGIIKRD